MRFKFLMPITKAVKTANRNLQMHIGDLEVSGVAKPITGGQVEIEYETMNWNGVDVLPLLDNLQKSDEAMGVIHTATLGHIQYKLESTEA